MATPPAASFAEDGRLQRFSMIHSFQFKNLSSGGPPQVGTPVRAIRATEKPPFDELVEERLAQRWFETEESSGLQKGEMQTRHLDELPPTARFERVVRTDSRNQDHLTLLRGVGGFAVPLHAALLTCVSGAVISTLRIVACGAAGIGTLTSSTPSANVAFTSSSFTPTGSGTER